MNKLNGIPAEKSAFFSGTYSSRCVSISLAGTTFYGKDKIEFEGIAVHTDYSSGYPTATLNEFIDNSEYYTDSSCTTLAISSDVRGTYAFSGEGKMLTLSPKSGSLTPKTSTAVTNLNNTNTCGISSWTINGQVDMTTNTCKSQLINQTYYVNASADLETLQLYECADETFEHCKSTTYRLE